MKKLFTILVIAVTMTNCSNEISEETISGGTWKIESSMLDGQKRESSDTYQFTSDNKVVRNSKHGAFVDSGTYTLIKNELKCTFTNPRLAYLIVQVKSIDKHTLKWETHNSAGFFQETFKR